MARFEITTPAANYNGISAGVSFANGKAVVSNDTQEGYSALSYFRGAGYGILPLDEMGVDEALSRANEDPETEARRLQAEIQSLETRESLQDLRKRRDELHAKVYGTDAPQAVDGDQPREAGEDGVVPPVLSPGAANYAEGDAPAIREGVEPSASGKAPQEGDDGESGGNSLLAPPADNAPVVEWRKWAVESGRAKAEDVEKTSRTDLIATHGADYDRDRAAQLNANAEVSK